MKTGYLIIITGPSGVGKTTAVNFLLDEIVLLKKVVSYTTRPKRVNEIDGKDYYFISEKRMKKLIKEDKSVRETVNQVYGYNYALSSRELDDIFMEKTNGIMELVIDRAIKWKKKLKKRAIIIFLLSPSVSIRKRLISREGGKRKKLQKRLDKLEYELQIPSLPQYSRFIDHIIVLSNDLEEMKRNIVDLIKRILKD